MQIIEPLSLALMSPPKAKGLDGARELFALQAKGSHLPFICHSPHVFTKSIMGTIVGETEDDVKFEMTRLGASEITYSILQTGNLRLVWFLSIERKRGRSIYLFVSFGPHSSAEKAPRAGDIQSKLRHRFLNSCSSNAQLAQFRGKELACRTRAVGVSSTYQVSHCSRVPSSCQQRAVRSQSQDQRVKKCHLET